MKLFYKALVVTLLINIPVVFNAMPGGGGGSITWTTVADGDWSNPNIWDQTGNIRPNDNVVINHVITLDVDETLSNLTINNSLSNTSQTLSVRGNFDASNGSYFESGIGRTSLLGGPAGTRSISGSIHFNNLEINVLGKTVQLASGAQVYIKNLLNLTAGTFNVSNGTLTLLNDGSNDGRVGTSTQGTLVGNCTWEHFVDRCNGWSNYAVPVNATLQDIASGNKIYTGFPNADYPDFPFTNTYFYSEAGGYAAPTDITNVASRGEGYWYWNSDTVFNSSNSSIPQQWTMILTGGLDLTQTFSFNLGYGNTNWNLLGNPYPGTLDWDNAGFSKTNINNAIYIFNTCTQTYSSYVNGIGINGGSRYIAPGQAFFVESNAAGPAVTSNRNTIVDNYIGLKRTTIPDVLFLWLNDDQIAISLNDDATNDFDGMYDAKKQLSDLAYLYTRLNQENYSINTLKNEEVILPLFVKGGGKLTFSGAQLFNDYDVLLEDKQKDTLINMKEVESYDFTTDKTNFMHRFNIIFKKSILSLNEDLSAELSLYPNPFSDKINLQLGGKIIDKIEVYDVLGKLVLSKTNNSERMSVDVSDLQKGAYMVKVFNNNQEVGVVMTQKM